MRTLLLISATVTALAVAGPAAANHGGHGQGPQYVGGVDPNCLSERRTSRNVGGFLGALGGASAGRALAAAAVRPEGVILGTVVGAVIGSSLGNAAVDCSPRPHYTQEGGRSYGASHHHGSHGQPQYAPQPVHHSAPVYQPPVQHTQVYQPPVHHTPVHHHAPVHQAPMHHAPVYQAPMHHAPVHHAPVHHGQVIVSQGDWYQPSPHSYMGQERRGPLVAAPAPIQRPDFVPQDSYVATGHMQHTVVTHSYHAGAHHSGQVVVAPHGAPCGFQVCR